nr:hypothetical protein [uncultured Actinoplanes sp.]
MTCSWFNQNFSEDFLIEPVLAGDIRIPAGDMVEPFVDAGDIADVVAAALLPPGLLSPALLSPALLPPGAASTWTAPPT